MPYNDKEKAAQPAKKKATVRDVAREAGVSVATVSYVLNDKKDAKISEATKKKVLQIANILNYRPNHSAMGLSTGKFHAIGIVYTLRADTPSRNAEILYTVNLLKDRFVRMGYACQLLSDELERRDGTPSHGLDGIIAIDLEEAVFKDIANRYYIPILCLDMRINDFLFYQIYSDRTPFFEAEELLGDNYIFVSEHFCNRAYEEYLRGALPNERVLSYPECAGISADSLNDRGLLVYGDYLGLIMSRFVAPERLAVISPHADSTAFPDGLRLIPHDIEKKANLATNIMLNAMEKKFDVKHEYCV